MDDAELTRAERARDALAAELLGRPEVSMIDIGADQADGATVVRVHVRDAASLGDLVPIAINGIRIEVVRGDYGLE